MNTQHISPRMLEAGEAEVRACFAKDGPPSEDWQAALAEAIYLAMRAKLVESRGGE